MSAASLNNRTLQLAELIISNEKYADSTGYVASTAAFSSTLTGTTLSQVGVINANSIGLIDGVNSISLSCSASSTLSVGGICNATAFGIVSGNNVVPLTCPANATLSVAAGGGTIEAGQLIITPGTINGTAGGAINLISESGIAIFSTISGTQYSGTLSVNAAGALLWNGVVIS